MLAFPGPPCAWAAVLSSEQEGECCSGRAFCVRESKSRPRGGLGLALVVLDLHLYGEGFGQLEAEGGFGWQHNFLVAGVGRACGSRSGSERCANEGAFAAAGQTADQCSAASSAADHGRSAFALAFEVAAN